MKLRFLLSGLFIYTSLFLFSQIVRSKVGTSSSPKEQVFIELVKKIQNYTSKDLEEGNTFDNSIYSPKSVLFLKNKMYVNSLEGFSTSVYEQGTWKRLGVISHRFNGDTSIIKSEVPFGYTYTTKSNPEVFKGKPVEFTSSHGGKYLWISYYRRSFDKNATQPSGLALIDTESDSIIGLFPTGPLPKMLASSDSTNQLAVTHWGDNTVGILNIEGKIDDFKYRKHLIIDRKLSFNFNNGERVNRDKNCGYCLRGTAFSENGNYLFVGRMGGDGKIDVFETDNFNKVGFIDNIRNNVRHIVIKGNQIFISTNVTGYVQKATLADFGKSNENQRLMLDWEEVYVGKGVRTISVSSDGKYIFAAVNNESKVVIIDTLSMKILSRIETDSYPVGMDISEDDKWLSVTAQGKRGEGGHSVSIYEITRIEN